MLAGRSWRRCRVPRIRAASRRPPSCLTSRPGARPVRLGRPPRTSSPARPAAGSSASRRPVCAACPLRAQCVRGVGGRTVSVHPQERLLQEARAFQASPAFADYRRRRQMVEHRIARLVQLGIRQARDVGTPKVRFQLLMAAAVANLTYLAASATQPTDPNSVAIALLAALLGLFVLAPEPPISAPDGPSAHRTTSDAPNRLHTDGTSLCCRPRSAWPVLGRSSRRRSATSPTIPGTGTSCFSALTRQSEARRHR